MPRVVLWMAAPLGIALSLAQPSRASDIVCETNFRSIPAECADAMPASADCSAYGDIRSKGERLVCDYAMLAHGYERIYEQQQEFLRQGKISESEIEAWRAKRDACDSVSCLDGVFTEWNQRADRRSAFPVVTATPSDTPPSAQQALQAESFAVRPLAASPFRELPAGTEPQTQEPVSVETLAVPERYSVEAEDSTRPPTAPTTQRDSNPLTNLVWLGFIGIFIARVLTPKRDRRFKTGYKNNRTVPTAVPILYGLSVVALLLGFLVM